jgi:glycosyltransferase involved in cell wall biosynthesis
VALCVTRLLYDKGLRELVEAARLLHARGSPVRVRVAGEPDPANPNSVSADDLAAWRAEGLVEFLGRRDDVAALLRDAHMAILPSYREGLPKSLLEAAASGRALITTQTVGCRDLVPDGATGLLVPVGDAAALADALDALARDPERRRAMGAAARRLAEDRFGNASVGAGIAAVYREALGRSG